MDPLSPIAPARVRALLLPVGRIKRSRFLAFVDRLRPHNVVRLGDVSPDGRPNRNMFSPLAFPSGLLLYDLAVSLPPESQSSLAPFELFRETLVVVAIADSPELAGNLSRKDSDGGGPGSPPGNDAVDRDEYGWLATQLDQLRAEFPRALVHQLFLFDHAHQSKGGLPDDITPVPPAEQVKTTTMKTIMCDLTSLLLAEMTTFAKSLQGLPTIESPSNPDNRPASNGSMAGYASLSEASNRNSMHPQAFPHGGRSDQLMKSDDTARHRMSMPAQLRGSSERDGSTGPGSRSGSPPARPSTPPPPTNFDEIAGVTRSPTKSPLANAVSRSSAGSALREPSRDRISVHGFGSGSLSERARNKGKGRVGQVIGSLYLQAGRWGDAVREHVESATIARNNSDHLWHAKALENILVGLLMFAWAGMGFQIPPICYPISDKAASSSTKSSSAADLNSSGSSTAPDRAVSLQNLTSLLPDLLNTILNLYTRASNFTGESLPQIAYSETCIRFSKLLAAVHLSDGHLDDQAIRRLVANSQPPGALQPGLPKISVLPTRVDITNMLFRAFPPQVTITSQTVTDRVLILAGIASVLASVGQHRKRAFTMREMITTLIPGLVQARRLGAAEMGVHPAAGLAALSAMNGGSPGVSAMDLGGGDVESGLRELLELLGRTYGVVSSGSFPVNGERLGQNGSPETTPSPPFADTDEAIISRIIRDSTLRSFGSQNLKLNILRYCINLCEALPDFHGVLRFTTELLRTAGSGIAPRSDSDEGSTNLSREEQIRLATNVSRTVSAAKKLGMQDVEAEYWDEFLARGVELMEPPLWKRPIPHAKSDLEVSGVTEERKEKSPFIYNPFLKMPAPVAAESLLVAGEPAEFRVTLQNPFEFEIEIERIRLEAEEAGFDSVQQGTIIGPYRTKMLSVSGTPTATGTLTITGCVVKIRGCRERRFPIFSEPWSPQHPTKIKSSGLAASLQPSTRPTSVASTGTSDLALAISPPRVSTLRASVIREQPVVIVKSTSLSQSAIMLLEGEVTTFSITLQNVSESTAVDLLLFSFQDSTAGPLQAAMSSKDTLPAELHELELLFAQKGAFRWRRSPDADEVVIKPGQTMSLEVEVVGKPGLTNGIIQLDYAHLGVPRREVSGTFYTRKVTVPVTVTVNASIELARIDFLPFNFASLDTRSRARRVVGGNSDEETDDEASLTTTKPHHVHDLFAKLHDGQKEHGHCLLLLDLRNTWPSSLTVDLQLRHPQSSHPSTSASVSTDDRSDFDKVAYTLTETIQAGQTSRLVLPLPRIFLANPHQPIPTLNPANQRQFVLGASKLSPEAERASREAFWYREEVLKMLHGTWAEGGNAGRRRGEIDLRSMRLSARMVEAVRVEEVGIEMTVSQSEPDPTVHHLTPSTYAIPTRSFLTLTTAIHNRTSHPIYPLLRIQPTVRHQPPHLALDISKRFLWHGVLQRALPVLHPGDSTSVDLGVCVLCRGAFEIYAAVEEARLPKTAQSEPTVPPGRTSSRPTVNARRVWGARESCVLLARDVDSPHEAEGVEGDDDGPESG